MGEEKMKIAFLSFYSGNVYRGVETFVHEVSNRLTDLGIEVTVYQGGPMLDGTRYKTVVIPIKVDWKQKVSNVPYLNYYSKKIKEFTTEVLKQIDKDTDILFPTNGQWQSLLCSLWCKMRNKKLVISGQSGPGRDDKLNLWTFPNIFCGLTNPQVEWAKNANPFIRVEKVSNGVDTKKFKANSYSIKIDLEKPIILVVAAFEEWKRIDLAIKAVSKLKMGSLMLVGKGDKEKDIKKLGSELLGDRFQILSLPYNEMPKVYRACDLFTYPTVPWESFGNVLVEAMASGLPVVATDDPIRREILGDAGIFVDPTDTTSYADALEKALKINWGDKPRNQAEKFDWDKIALRYEEIFKTLI